jgi:hypothetical protein
MELKLLKRMDSPGLDLCLRVDVSGVNRCIASLITIQQHMEGLAVFRGSACLRFGASDDDNPDDGVELNVKIGDVLVISAGAAHCAVKNLDGSVWLECILRFVRRLYELMSRVLLSGICDMEELQR